MRNFNENELQYLVENGFLMPSGAEYYISYYPGKEKKRYSTVGFPVIMDKAEFIKSSKNFPSQIFKDYHFTIKNQGNYYHDAFLIPNGLQEMIDFNIHNEALVNKLKEWIQLSEVYILEATKEKEEFEIELTLLRIFRELYFLYLQDIKTNISPINDKFFILHQNGSIHRQFLFSILPKNHALINNTSLPIFNSVLETTEDIILFENSAIFNKVKLPRFCNIPISILHLWNALITQKYGKSCYNETSPFLKSFKKVLYDNYSRSIKDTIHILEWVNLYDFSVIKDIYIYFLTNSSKTSLIKYVEDKLKSHNALPEVSQELLVKQENSTIYNAKFYFNFNLIKTYVNHHIYAAECLMGIVQVSFEKEEPDCTRIEWRNIEESNTIVFSIETLQSDKVNTLNEKLISYINAVLSSEFLDNDMIKLLSKHSSNSYSRKRYEDNKEVILKYLHVKQKFVLKEHLDKKLTKKLKSTEKVKKI